MEISPKRILYLDEVRALAIILVVIGHLVRMFPRDFTSWTVCSGVFSVTRIGVPLFFTVSGALLLTRKHDIEQFLTKRFKRVVLPFAFWIIVYLIAGVVIWKYQPTLNYCFDVIFGSSDLSNLFWFIWSLIGVYLLIPVLSSFIREYGNFGSKYLIAITIILSILYTMGFFDPQQIKYNFKLIFYFFSVLGYFIMGSYIHNHEFKASNKKIVTVAFILLITGYVGHFAQVYMKGLGGLSLAPVDFFDIFVIAETMGLFTIFRYGDFKIGESLKKRKVAKFIVLFSSCSFGIYFSHYILMKLLFFNSIFTPIANFNVYMGLPACAVILIGISWLLIYIMSKIPILNIGSGVK